MNKSPIALRRLLLPAGVIAMGIGVYFVWPWIFPSSGGPGRLGSLGPLEAPLLKGSDLTLYALTPSPPNLVKGIAGEEVSTPPVAADRLMHGFLIEGSAPIRSASQRKEIIQAIRDAMSGEGNPMRCFSPRHALSISFDEKRIDVVLCFECGTMRIYGLRSERMELVISDSGREMLTSILFSEGAWRKKPRRPSNKSMN
ncbi:MAG: hypothetical protein ACI957_003080 [Verrucomicrobiales bacterium]|jgi:hypothetical protein